MARTPFKMATAAMATAGKRTGTAAATWVADGNTSDATLRKMLRELEDDELEAPSPFSGKFADSKTVEEVVDEETDLKAEDLQPEELDELATAFEDAYWAAYHAEAKRTVRGLLGPKSKPRKKRGK